jgi:hypothetical protein
MPKNALVAVAIVAVFAGNAQAAPLWQENTSNLGVQPCADANGAGCYSHYTIATDLDGDSHLDIIFANGGGYYVPALPQPLIILRGKGDGTFTDVSSTAIGNFTGRVRQVAVGDIDGDGDKDLIVADAYGMAPVAVFINQGQMVFANEAAKRLATTVRSPAARLGDLDMDGDLDLILTDWGDRPFRSQGTANVFLNDGKGAFTAAPAAMPPANATLGIGTGPIDLDLFDADNDGDLDLVLASRAGESLLFLWDQKNKAFVDANASLPDQPGPYVYGPDVCDVDGDGDLDLWLDNGGIDVTEQLLRNDGGSFVDISASSVRGNGKADDNEVQCVDIDQDGDFDAVIASLDDVERVLINDSTASSMSFMLKPDVLPQSAAGPDPTLGMDWGDFNEDGRLDFVTAQGENMPMENRLYLATASVAKDTRGPRFRNAIIRSIRDGDAVVTTVVIGISDSTTTDAGPRLSAASTLVGKASDDNTASPLLKTPLVFAGGDLFRAVVRTPSTDYLGDITLCARDVADNATCKTFRDPTYDTVKSKSSGGCGCGSTSSSQPIVVSVFLLLFFMQRDCRTVDARHSRASVLPTSE